MRHNHYLHISFIILLIINFLTPESKALNISDLRLGTNNEYSNLLITPSFDKYNLKGHGLKGNVYKIVTKKQPFRLVYGDTVYDPPRVIDSLIFDENKNLKEEYLFTNNKPSFTYLYKINQDSIYIISPTKRKGGYAANGDEIYQTVYDDNGRLIELKGDDDSNGDLNPHRIQTFKYTDKGYTSEFWLGPSVKRDIVRVGNKLSFEDQTSPFNTDKITIFFNQIDLPIKVTVERSMFKSSSMFKPKVNRFYKYNKYNDIIGFGKEENGEEILLESYSYEYDNHGNWVKRKGFDEDGKLRGITLREITYNTPEEIIQIEADKRENRKIEIKRKVAQIAKPHIDHKKKIEANQARNNKKNPFIITSTNVIDDKYSFYSGDSIKFENINFVENTTGPWEIGFLIDPTYTYYLLMSEKFYGPDWYLITVEDNPENMIEIDWLNFYNSIYAEWEEPEDYKIEKKVKEYISEIYDYHGSDYSPYFITKLYILKNAYKNGFVSPSITYKDDERGLIEKGNRNREFDHLPALAAKAYVMCLPHLNLNFKNPILNAQDLADDIIEVSEKFEGQEIPMISEIGKLKNYKEKNDALNIVFDDGSVYELKNLKGVGDPVYQSPFTYWSNKNPHIILIPDSEDVIIIIEGTKMFFVDIINKKINWYQNKKLSPERGKFY